MNSDSIVQTTLDPRTKNRIFTMESPIAYLREYSKTLESVLGAVNPEALEQAVGLLTKTIASGKRVYVCGNGGSAAIADHLCCDWTKGTRIPNKPVLKTHSLSANGALLTALANDISYAEAYSTQVDMFGEKDDVLVAISSSGTSKNIINAVRIAQERGMKTIGLSGFSGGDLAKTSDISLHVAFENYGLVEDAHQVIMHVLSQYLVRQLELKG